jgi:CopG family nickel-responsive transcriptional regulator
MDREPNPLSGAPTAFAVRSKRVSDLVRFGVSMEAGLLADFDAHVRRAGYTGRSEAIRDLIRDHLIGRRIRAEAGQVVGTVTLVYDHHVRGLQRRLTAIQHDHHSAVLSTMHLHLDHAHCLEVLVIRGRPAEVRTMADRLGALKGVTHCKMNVTTVPGPDDGGH